MSTAIQKENIYIVANPDKIILSKNADGKWFSKITLNNVTHNYIIFKVFINKEQLYSANPSVGFIEPRGNVQITIKRIMNVIIRINKDANDDTLQGNDKFLIKAYISHKKLTDVGYYINQVEETKKLITQEELQSPLTQALLLMTTFNNENNRLSTNPNKTMRSSDQAMDSNRSDPNYDDRKSVYTVSTNIANVNPFGTRPAGNLEEWKKKVEERKLQIKDIEHENEKLIHQKNNLMINSKNYSKKVNVMTERDKTQVKNTYPFFFLVFVMTIGVIFGSFLNKLF